MYTFSGKCNPNFPHDPHQKCCCFCDFKQSVDLALFGRAAVAIAVVVI